MNFHRRRHHSQPQRTEPCRCAGGQPWACHGKLHDHTATALCGRFGGACMGAAAGLGRWRTVGVAVLPVCGGFERRQHSATTAAHRALPVCEWPTLGSMPWGSATSNAASAVRSRYDGACTGGYGRARQVVCGGCGFEGLWAFPEEDAALNNRSVQSPASV